MRLSTRLVSNAATTYWRLGTTFGIGIFSTWYILGAVGVTGFGLMALAVSSVSPSRALDRALRFGLVRELAAAIASGDEQAILRNVNSSFRLCRQVAIPLLAVAGALAGLAWWGVFNTPDGALPLELALAALILAEGVHAAVRLISAPFLQSLFAGREVGIDNLLLVTARATYALSAVLVFGWWLADADLATQMFGFAASRCTLQLLDVAIGLWLTRRRYPFLRLDRQAFDHDEYRAVRDTVWHSSQVNLLLNINPQLLAVLINLFFGLSYNTIWQIVVQFTGYAWMLAEGLMRGIGPMVTHLQSQGKAHAVVNLMVRSVRYQLTVALPAAVFLGVWAEPLLRLWVGGRWTIDPSLSSAGLPVDQALTLSAHMALLVLVVNALRAGFFAIERGLYGMGKVKSYSWFSKWATLVTVGGGALLMATLDHPMAAPVAMLVGYALYSPGVVLLAARREIGLPVFQTLRRSVVRPAAAAALFLACQVWVRQSVDTLTLVRLIQLLAGSAILFAVLVVALVPAADERQRLGQMARRGLGWIRARFSRR